MLLGTFISRHQQIHTEPDPPFLGHVPACFTHTKLSLSGGFFFRSLPILLLHSVNKGTPVTIPNCSFLFAWEQNQLFVGLLLQLFFFPFKLVTVETLAGTCGFAAATLDTAGFGTHWLRAITEEAMEKAVSCMEEISAPTKGPGQHSPNCSSQTVGIFCRRFWSSPSPQLPQISAHSLQMLP